MTAAAPSINGRDIRPTALRYIARGWSVIPLPPNSKRPRLDNWQLLRITTADVSTMFTSMGNVGVLLGEASSNTEGNLIDVDLDHPLAVELADKFLPPTDSEFGRASKRRSHRLYRVPETIDTKKWKLPDGTMIVELRSDGTQTIFPGSFHSDTFEAVDWDTDGDAAVVAADVLLAACEALAVAVGYVPRATAQAAGPAIQTGQQASAILYRARKYIAAMPAAVSGSGGHAATFAVATAAAIGFGLGVEDTLDLLREFNGRCVPPWSDAELLHKARSAQQADGERGYLLNSVPVLGSNGPAAAAATVEPKPIRYTRLTCRELSQAVYDLSYLIDGTLVKGQPCIVAGSKKTLKTSFLIDAGISLALGAPFLGQLATTPATVAIMSGESGLATLQETGRRIAESKGHDLGDIERLTWSTDLPQFGNALHTDALREFLVTGAVEVLFVDPAYLAMPGGDAGNLFLQGELLQGVSRLCGELGVTLVLAHHCRKGVIDPFAPPELEDIAWAGFQEFARQWWLIGRRERYEPGSGEHRLWLSIGGSAGHSALWGVDVSEGVGHGSRRWEVSTHHAGEVRTDARQRQDAAKAARRQETLNADKQAIVTAMARTTDGDTTTAIRNASGIRSTRFNEALAALLRERTITRIDIIKGNNRHYEGYTLTDHDDEKGQP